jgi:organic radical activating enzyme
VKPEVVGPTAALAGIPAGLQGQGVWAGRRQLFIRFAAEAETATMYTAQALASELKRSAARSAFHSVSISGRDPLANVEYLQAAFAKSPVALPVMLDGDGQRPDELSELKHVLTMVQITIDGSPLEAVSERAFESIGAAKDAGLQHAVVLASDERTSDAQLLRLIERVHATSANTVVVVHPPPGAAVDRDRRWATVFERASALHGDVRLALRLPPPTGMR